MNPKINYGKKTNIALNTWVKLARASSKFHRVALENVKTLNLTLPQFAVLEALGHIGPMKIGVLTEKMIVSGGNMTLVLDNLEEQGLLQRVHSKNDRRAINIELTKKGRQVFNTLFPKHAEFVAKQMSVLNENEQKELGRLLKKLGTSIE